MRELAQRIASEPADAAALNALGVLLAQRGYLGRAAAQFERVIELLPGFAGGYGNLATCSTSKGGIRMRCAATRRGSRSRSGRRCTSSWRSPGASSDDSTEPGSTYRRAMELDQPLVPAGVGRRPANRGTTGAKAP